MQTKLNLTPYYNEWFDGSTPFFYYAPLENEVRDLNMLKEGEKIDLSSFSGVDLTNTLGEGYTIIVGFKLDNLPKKTD